MSEVVERLVTEWIVNPTEGIRGFDLAEAKALEFQKLINSVASSLPDINPALFLKGANQEFEKQIGNLRAMRHEAQVTAQVMAALDKAMPAGPQLGPAAPPIVTRDKVRELQALSTQLQQSQVVADQFTGSLSRMNMQLLSRASGRIGDNGASFDRGLAQLAANSTVATESLTKSNRAANLARTGLVGLSTQALGTGSAFGSLAQSVLFATGGFGAVAGVAVGALAAIKIYESLTKAVREAREEQDKLVASGVARGGVGVQSGPAAEDAAIAKRLFDLGKARVELEGDLERRIGLTATGRARQLILEQVITEETRLRAVQMQLEVDRAEALRQAMLGAAEAGIGFSQSLARSAESSAMALAKFKADTAALGPQTFGSQPGFVSIEEEQAMRRRIALAKESTAAQIEGLEQLRVVASQASATTDAEKIAKQSRIDALTVQINLRQLEGIEQAKAIQREMELLQLTRQRAAEVQAHLNRVTAAGGGNLTQGAGGAGGISAPVPPILRGAREQGLTSNAIGNAGEFARIVEQIKLAKEEAKRFRDAEREARTEAEILADTFTDIGSAAFALADVGRSLGFIGDNAARSIEDVGRLSDALSAVAANASFGNILGAVSAGAGLLGSLPGVSGPTKTEQLLAENNQRLADLKASLDESINTLAGLTASQDLLAQVGTAPRLIGPKGMDLGPDLTKFREQILASGMTVEEWAARVEMQTGLDVLDDKGRIVAATLEQANTAYKILIEDAQKREAAEAERVAADLLEQASRDAADRLRETAAAAKAVRDAFIAQQVAFGEAERARTPGLLELRRQLTGKADDPNQQFQDALGPLRDTFGGGPLGDIVKGFSGFNLDDPAAREALSQRVLEYVNKLLSGTSGIPPELIDTFVGAMGDITGILGGFADAANQATRSLSNVPQSINIAAYEFRAQAARARDVASVKPVDPKQFLPNVDTVTGRTGGSRPLNDLLPTPIHRMPAGEAQPVLKLADSVEAKLSDLISTLEAGGLTTNLGKFAEAMQRVAGGDVEGAALKLREAFKRIAMRTTGNPDDWGAT